MEIEGKRTRGRPRPAATVQLDADVLAYLESAGAAHTRKAITDGVLAARTARAEQQAQATGKRPAPVKPVEEKRVYLALRRLREAGRVRKCAGEGLYTTWIAASEQCP